MAMKNVQKYLDKGTKAPGETMNTIRAFRSSGNLCQALYAGNLHSKRYGTPTFPRAPKIDNSPDNEEAKLSTDRWMDKEDLL